jgi:hypothetical protein
MVDVAFGHMLENPSIPHYRPQGGDNVLGADNQQERLINSDQNPQRPYAEHPGDWMKIWSRLHGDMQG